MNSDIDTQLEQARQHLENNEGQLAHSLLLDILQTQPSNQPALLMLGGYYFTTGKLAEAEMIFEQLILQAPGTGQYSIALFNTLWKQSRVDEAFEEVRRFMSVADKTAEKQTIDQYIEITRQFAQQHKNNLD